MRRLFVFGCSYTKYYWPTWADLLSLNFDYYENWGIGGVGNQCIAQRVQECHLKNKFTKKDTVIVQWSSYTRHDCFLDKWQPRGSIFAENHNNIDIYTPRWMAAFFSEKGFLLNTLSNINFTQELLSTTECTWYMTSMSDILSLNTDLIDQRSTDYMTCYIEFKKDALYEKYPELKIYTEKIWNYKNWITDFAKIYNEHPNKYYSFIDNSFEPYGFKTWTDYHPSPEQFNLWLEKYCCNLFDLDTYSQARSDIIKAVDSIKSNLLYLPFLEKIYKKSDNPISQYFSWWPMKIKGF